MAETVPRGPDKLSALLARRRPLVMGILNVTPDSFSDGGRFARSGRGCQADPVRLNR
jgi:dihydropteroate synthase